jgi:hypothetical protein
VVWVNGEGLTDLGDIVGDTVPEELVDEVLTLVRCPECGSDVDAWGVVGTQWEFELAHLERVATATRRWSKKLDNFAAFLDRTPTLGAMHPVGKRLLREISTFAGTQLRRGNWYRARRDKGTVFTSDDLGVPPSSAVTTPVGRWNHPGQRHWYLADGPDAALAEVLADGEEIGWVQKWEVPQTSGILDLLSFSADDPRRISDARVEDIPLLGVAIIFDGFLSRPAERGWKPEYLVPHFVMDAAKLAGFAGIRHESAKDRGINLVIFDPEAPLLAINAPEKMRLNDPARDPFHFDGPAIDMSALL